MANKYKLITLLVCLLIAGQAMAASVITGTWNRAKRIKEDTKEVNLFEVRNGHLIKIATSILTENKEFTFAINNTKEQMYVIGLNPLVLTDHYAFYLKLNDKLNVAVGETNFQLIGNENSPENKEMERWHNFIFAVDDCAYNQPISTYVEFFPVLEEKLEDLDNFKKKTYKKNKLFAKTFNLYTDLYMKTVALYYLFTPRTAHPKGEDFPDYYATLTLESLTMNDDLLDFPFGSSLLRSNRTHQRRSIKKGEVERNLDTELAEIQSDAIKGEVVLEHADRMQSYEGLKSVEDKYGKYLVQDDQKKRFRSLINKKGKTEEGKEAVDFTFRNTKNEKVSLSDFKGKVVYIDIWATWCGPCIQQGPYWNKLAQQYEGKDIVFLGVSTDAEKDYDKWEKMLVDKQMEGVQLFAGKDRAQIDEPYQIKGIPRFILVGKDGKTIADNAPRPSVPEITVMIDAALAK